MTATLNGVTPRKRPVALSPEMDAAKERVRLAREQSLALTGPDGLLKQLTREGPISDMGWETTAGEGFRCSKRRTVLLEGSEHVAGGGADFVDFVVRIEHNLTVFVIDQPDRQGQAQLASRSCRSAGAMRPPRQ